MKIDYLSDLHLDFYFPINDVKKEAVQSIFDPIFLNNKESIPGEVLIIAGDVGHHNSQNIEILRIFQECYYKYIICVLGNHDYYLINRIQEDDYDSDSLKRAQEMTELINFEENMYCLDGDVVEIEGVKFGGAMGWYSDAYTNRYYPLTKDKKINNDWILYSNDSQKIMSSNINRYDDLYRIELPKIEKVYKECDVMVTHINPSYLHEHMCDAYHNIESNNFFTTDYHKYIKNGSMKYWVFGHTHDEVGYQFENTTVLCNPFGYPSESNYGDWIWIKSFEV